MLLAWRVLLLLAWVLFLLWVLLLWPWVATKLYIYPISPLLTLSLPALVSHLSLLSCSSSSLDILATPPLTFIITASVLSPLSSQSPPSLQPLSPFQFSYKSPSTSIPLPHPHPIPPEITLDSIINGRSTRESKGIATKLLRCQLTYK